MDGPADPPLDPVDLTEHGLNLNSTLASFEITFAPTPSFDKSVVNLTKYWQDDMGLHLLQRSMLPLRLVRCIITLNGILKIIESYESVMGRSVQVRLSELILEDGIEKGTDFVLQLRVAGKQQTFSLEEHFEANKFKLGGVAKREIAARGFQIAGVKENQLLITQCRHLRIVVKDWRTIQDPTEFSPRIVNLINGARDLRNIRSVSTGDHAIPVKIIGDELDVVSPRVIMDVKRPCACYNTDASEDNEAGIKHSDVCDSRWAVLFDKYAASVRSRKATGGLSSSRWAAGG